MLVELALDRRPGIFHVTNSGADHLVRLRLVRSRPSPAPTRPASSRSPTAELEPPRPAPRPANSVLDNARAPLSGLRLLPALGGSRPRRSSASSWLQSPEKGRRGPASSPSSSTTTPATRCSAVSRAALRRGRGDRRRRQRLARRLAQRPGRRGPRGHARADRGATSATAAPRTAAPRRSDAEFLLVCNPDLVLGPDSVKSTHRGARGPSRRSGRRAAHPEQCGRALPLGAGLSEPHRRRGTRLHRPVPPNNPFSRRYRLAAADLDRAA